MAVWPCGRVNVWPCGGVPKMRKADRESCYDQMAIALWQMSEIGMCIFNKFSNKQDPD